MVKGVCSKYGNRKKMPGPRTPPKRPRRNTTLRSHSLHMRSEDRIVITTSMAMMRRPIVAGSMPVRLQDQDDTWPQCTPAVGLTTGSEQREHNGRVNPATTSSQRLAAKLDPQRGGRDALTASVRFEALDAVTVRGQSKSGIR